MFRSVLISAALFTMATQSSNYPPGTNFWETPDWAGGTQARLNTALIVISGCFLATRLYVRCFMTKSAGLDDLVACLAFGVITSQSGWNIHLKDCGAGAHMELIPGPLIMKFFVVSKTEHHVLPIHIVDMKSAMIGFAKSESTVFLGCRS